MLKYYVAEYLARNKKVRYGLALLLLIAIVSIVVYERASTAVHIEAEKNIECPDLNIGCQLEVRNTPYKIRTDAPVVAGKPFVLYLEGPGVKMRALWKMPGGKVTPNAYILKAEGLNYWKTAMVLPEVKVSGDGWVLHMEINARAVDVITRPRHE